MGWQDDKHGSGLGFSSVLILAEGTWTSHFFLSFSFLIYKLKIRTLPTSQDGCEAYI